MKKLSLLFAVLSLVVIVIIGQLRQRERPEDSLTELRRSLSAVGERSADHSRFAGLDQSFRDASEVTAVCIECHNQTAAEVMAGNHWNWEREEYIPDRGIVYLGKKNALNNFCIGTRGNEQSCAKCHVGYGMDTAGNVFVDADNIDCLVCHDNTETYVKGRGLAGRPAANVDLRAVAMSVGRPQRSNCGVCHYYGGGGNNVKHGDLDVALDNADRELDVHMDIAGANLQCVDCHQTRDHNIAGKVYSLSSMNTNRNRCEDCHGEAPHSDDVLNEHNLKVACQSCHIPRYAKANATKMSWDWSTAGRLQDGQPFHEEDSLGNHTYLSIKGSFTWERDLAPDYIWFNGTASHYLKGDVVGDTSQILILNQLHGNYADPEARIVPVKLHVARQPFDPVTGMLIIPKLWASEKGLGAFWRDFNWQQAASIGMRESGLPFSGEMRFIETGMYWPVNHMVAPAQEALTCSECHQREASRLAGLTDFYLPGRDYSASLDTAGLLLIFASLSGVLGHGFLRLVSSLRRKGKAIDED
jgi:octaheme c-type cytochrome (tetrathionate reductase family)